MLSVRNPGKIYPVVKDVAEFDVGAEVEEYNYDGKTVYRGNLDPAHSTESVSVYWLYGEAGTRVGLAEHEGDSHTALWYRDTPFGTFFQEDWVAEDKTVWSLMTQAAYEDCVRHGWTTMDSLKQRTRFGIVTISDLIQGIQPVKRCARCLGTPQPNCSQITQSLKLTPLTSVFVDEDGVVYTPPEDSRVFSKNEEPVRRVRPQTGVGSSSK